MSSLQKMFPSLTLFSDLNWDQVTEEYQRDYGDISFPEYLQQKALDGDCPSYLFELAFYELAQFEVHHYGEARPHTSGIHLNPSALFLGLDFDVARMIREAQEGRIEIYERPHALCIFLDNKDQIQELELTDPELALLESLEDGPKENKNFVRQEDEKAFNRLIERGLIFYIP